MPTPGYSLKPLARLSRFQSIYDHLLGLRPARAMTEEGEMQDRQRFDRMLIERAKSKLQIRQQWREMMQAETSVAQVASAFAVGTFIGLVPLPGVDIVLTALVLKSFRQLERLPLFIAMTVWNNLVAAPLYAVGYRVGDLCLTLAPFAIAENVSHAAAAWTLRFLVGNLIVASVTAIASYFAVKNGLGRYNSSSKTVYHEGTKITKEKRRLKRSS